MHSSKSQNPRRFERFLITGAGGFTGRFLSEYIQTSLEDTQVFGLDIRAPERADIHIYLADMTDRESLVEIVSQVKPDCVLHLASIFRSNRLEHLYQVNVIGTTNLLEILLHEELSPVPVVVIVGSSAKYGAVSDTDLPISEQMPPRPVSHYGITKAAQEWIGSQFHLDQKMQIIQACPFNLVGPGQSEAFLCGSIVKQIVDARRAGNAPILKLGNLSSRRDYIDVRDAVQAYFKLAVSGEFGETYNVCSGTAYSGYEVLDLCSEIAGIELEIEQVEAKKRDVDVPVQIGDYHKLSMATDWKPRMSLRDSLRDMLDFQSNLAGAP